MSSFVFPPVLFSHPGLDESRRGVRHLGRWKPGQIVEMCCILRIGQVDDLQCLHRAAHYTNRQFALVYALVAHFTFGDLTEVFVEAGDAIRTRHRAEFAADAAFVVMCDDTVVTLGIGTGGTRLQTGGVITVVAGEGYADPAGLGEILFLHVVDLAPMDGCFLLVEVLAGDFACVAANAAIRMDEKSISFAQEDHSFQTFVTATKLSWNATPGAPVAFFPMSAGMARRVALILNGRSFSHIW